MATEDTVPSLDHTTALLLNGTIITPRPERHQFFCLMHAIAVGCLWEALLGWAIGGIEAPFEAPFEAPLEPARSRPYIVTLAGPSMWDLPNKTTVVRYHAGVQLRNRPLAKEFYEPDAKRQADRRRTLRPNVTVAQPQSPGSS